jgi:hypothetical protein
MSFFEYLLPNFRLLTPKPANMTAVSINVCNLRVKHINTSLSTIRRGFAPGFVNYKKGALDSQPQVIKFTSCLPMVGGSAYSTTKTGRHDIAEILLKVA